MRCRVGNSWQRCGSEHLDDAMTRIEILEILGIRANLSYILCGDLPVTRNDVPFAIMKQRLFLDEVSFQTFHLIMPMVSARTPHTRPTGPL